jgi:hypothetical protein
LLKIADKISRETDPPPQISQQTKYGRDLLYECLEDHGDGTIRVMNEILETQREWNENETWLCEQQTFFAFFFLSNIYFLS